MAYIFYEAIVKAVDAGQVMPPAADIEVPGPVCDKFSGMGISPGGRTQRGNGNDDGIYRHYDEDMGVRNAAQFRPKIHSLINLDRLDYGERMGPGSVALCSTVLGRVR